MEIAIGILRADPKEDVTPARGWALDIIEKNSGVGSVMSGRRSLIKGYFWRCAGRGCGHVFGLSRGQLDPLALMLSADPLPRSEQRA